MDMKTPSVLFVCLGNICRSPTAEAVFRKLAADAKLNVKIESAGTGAWHQGDTPDPRAMTHGIKRGYSFKGQTARKVRDEDFEDFDFILAMDSQNLRDLKDRCPPEYIHKLALFLNYAKDATTNQVPDPYYGGDQGFENVLDLIEAASDGLIEELQNPS